MFETLKILHMFALMGGGAASIGNGILMARVMAAEGPPPPYVPATMKMLGQIGLGSIIVLWLSGIGMSVSLGAELSTPYIIKLIGAAMVLGAASTMSLHAARAAKAGGPPNLGFMKKISRIAQVGVILAVIFAVLTFA